MYYLVDLGDELYVVCEKRSIHAEDFVAVTNVISGATWAREICNDLNKDGPACKRQPLTQYHMRPGK